MQQPAVTSPDEVRPFGPVTTVVPANCEFEYVTGDSALDAQGTIHAFVAFALGSCDSEPVIHYAKASGTSWTSTPTPYRGQVLASAVDGTDLWLLYLNGDGVQLARQHGGGLTSSEVLSQPSSSTWRSGQGALVARDGRWWAVWTERQTPEQPFGLFQASTLTTGGERSRQPIASTLPDVLHNIQPSLVLDPAVPGGAALAWTAVMVGSDAVAVRFARAHADDAVWHEHAWVPPQPEFDRRVNGPHLLATDGHLHGAYEDDGTIVHTLDPPDGGVTTRFRKKGIFPLVAHAADRTFVAWTASEVEAPEHVFVAERSTTGVTRELDLNPGGGRQQLVGAVAHEGRATVLGVSFTSYRLWSRAQT